MIFNQASMAQQEQDIEARRKEALRLVDIGYKELAKKLHPDLGGSQEEMTRLNKVREHLIEVAWCIRDWRRRRRI